MDGVFMRKIVKLFAVLLVFGLVLEIADLVLDKQTLRQSLIRLHVVAASDSEEDQNVKLQVRDAVVAYVDQAMSHVMTISEAKAWLEENLLGIQNAANEVLGKLGVQHEARVCLNEEAFPVRHYDSFSLPAGVYSALRVTIGEGQGKNWWCVVFPKLCMPVQGENTEDVAAGAGFSQELTNTVTRQEGYKVRFFFLDLLGKIENFLFGA